MDEKTLWNDIVEMEKTTIATWFIGGLVGFGLVYGAFWMAYVVQSLFIG